MLKRGDTFDSTITPTMPHDYLIKLSRGESVNLSVEQKGVDLALELRGPNQSLLGVFDSPNGRNGPEPLEIIATESGAYRVRVRAFDANEPAGRYTLAVTAWRNASETRSLLESRRLARVSASAWLAKRSAPIPGNAVIPANAELASFDSLATRAQIIGIGEATHGSREFGSLRISLTKRLIQRHGFRVVAIEASSARLRLLNAYVSGVSPTNSGGPDDFQWIGAASRRELVPFLREWNDAHPTDKVFLVGVDPQDNAFARDSLRAFLLRAYGQDVVTRLQPMFAEFAAADSQVMVFGNSSIDSLSRRTILALNSMLDLDAPMLARRLGSESVANARMITRDLAQMADFNGGGPPVSHSRDFYMAANILLAMEQLGPRAKTIFWAHNAHVSHPSGQSESGRSTGAWLRALLGCDYAALGVTFGKGAFVAEIPNDSTDRLAVSSLPFPDSERVENVFSHIGRGGAIAAWGCDTTSASAPGWLQSPQKMHWVGALFAPGTLPSEAFRSYSLLKDFDAIAFIAEVSADELPRTRPIIPARRVR